MTIPGGTALANILVPVDFGDASRAALALATQWAQKTNARVKIVHVIDTPSFLSPQLSVAFGASGEVTTFDDVVRREALGQLGELLGALPRAAANTIDAEIVGGDPLRVILEHGASADLIVIGTHAKPGLGRFMLGTLADRIMRSAEGSVLTVHEDDRPDVPEKFLVAVDCSPGSRAALLEAAELRTCFGGTIRALHVVPQPTSVAAQGLFVVDDDDGRVSLEDHLRREALEKIDAFVRDVLGTTPVRIDVEIGSPGDIIPIAAESADLVLMGTRGATGFERLATGSVAGRVARSAPCPVLTVRRASTSA